MLLYEQNGANLGKFRYPNLKLKRIVLIFMCFLSSIQLTFLSLLRIKFCCFHLLSFLHLPPPPSPYLPSPPPFSPPPPHPPSLPPSLPLPFFPRPFNWGKVALELQESRRGLSWVQWSPPTTDRVLELLEQQRMRQSLHHFPHNAPLEVSVCVCVLILCCCVFSINFLSNYENFCSNCVLTL